jgi:hypothetical protein
MVKVIRVVWWQLYCVWKMSELGYGKKEGKTGEFIPLAGDGTGRQTRERGFYPMTW